MNGVMSSTGRWAVSARTTGEVLVTRTDAGEISVVRFGGELPAGAEVVNGLNEIMDASRQAAKLSGSSSEGPIPGLLHQALARLLAFEVPGGGGVLILFDDGHDATVATIGDVDVRLQIDGSDAHRPWVRVRDRSGHEARAYPIPADRQSAFALQWPQKRQPGAQGVEIDACWPGAIVETVHETHENPALARLVSDAVAEAPAHAAAGAVESSAGGAVESSAGGAADSSAGGAVEEKEGFLQWFDRLRGRRQQNAEDAEQSTPEQIPPSPEPQWLTASAVDPAAAETHATLDVEQSHADTSSSPTAEVAREHEVPPIESQVVTNVPHVGEQTFDEFHATLPPRRPVWPAPEQIEIPLWKKPWAWGVLAVAVMCGAVMIANFVQRPMSPAKSLVPMFGPRFAVTINSRPPGAWIAIDGKDTGRLTPSTLELTPGKHQVTLTMSDRGSATVPLEGEPNQRTSIDAALYGAVNITSTDSRVPVSITLDGLERGYAPLLLEDVLPGPHEIRFRAPGMDPWAETFEVRIGETHDILARPFTVPDKGLIEIRATIAADGAAEPLKGASVYIDGELRGTTPARIELPHGPHSIRLSYKDEDLPVQVIDLPGGNHLFANFAFGSGKDVPRMMQTSSVGPFSRDQPAVVSSAITGIAESDLREMWLHVRSPDRTWKRYEMTLLRAEGGVVGVAVFPPPMIGQDGSAIYYTRAMMQVGDEYFTELRTGRKEPRPVQRTSRAVRAAPVSEAALPVMPLTTPSAGAETP